MFLAGEVHSYLEAWNVILQDYQDGETILGYISRKVNILEFLRPFRGVFKVVHYVSPSTVLLLMFSCLRFAQYYPPRFAKWFSVLFGTGGHLDA